MNRMQSIRWLGLLGLLQLCMLPAKGQQFATLSGFVADSSNGEWLIGANVILEGTGKGASANSSGFFAITRVEAGEYIVICSYIGFEPFRQVVTVAPGESRRLDIQLTPEAEFLEEVVVSAGRLAEEESRNIGVGQISIQTVKELPTILEPDVFRTLQLLPGVTAASDYSSGLYIRGGNPGQTLILLDRTKIYNPSHVFGFFSTFNPDAIKDLRLHKGGYPAFYGGSLGAVLDVNNKDGNRLKHHGGLSLGLLASRAFVEGPYSKGSWMLAVRRSTLEPLLAALDDVDGIPDAFHFYDVNGKFNLDATQNDRVSISFYVGSDHLRFGFYEDTSIGLDYGNATLTGTWVHLFSSKLLANFTATTSRYNSTPRVVIAGTEIRQENSIYETSLRVDFEYFSDRQHDIKTGIWAGRFLAPLKTFFDGQDSFTSRNRVEHAAAYVQDTWRPSPQWLMTGGLRATYFANGDHFTLAPRFSIEHRLNPDIRLQASVGRYYQFQTLVTNESFSGFDYWLTSGRGVKPAFGNQYIMGAKTNLPAGFALDTEVYYRTMRDLFEPDPFLADPSGLEYRDLFTFGEGTAQGLEVQLMRNVGRLYGFLAYTLGATNRSFDGINTDGQRQPRTFKPKHDRLHDFNGVVSWDIGRRWTLNAVFSYATGQAYTNPEARYQLQNTDEITGVATTDVLLSRGLNGARLPDYHRLDIGATWKGGFFGFADYELQLQVINAYARRNTWFISHQFQPDGTVDNVDVPQIPIPLPNIAFTLKF